MGGSRRRQEGKRARLTSTPRHAPSGWQTDRLSEVAAAHLLSLGQGRGSSFVIPNAFAALTLVEPYGFAGCRIKDGMPEKRKCRAGRAPGALFLALRLG